MGIQGEYGAPQVSDFSRPGFPTAWFLVAGEVSTVELHDPAKGAWSGSGGMSIARYEHPFVLVLNGQDWRLEACQQLFTLATAELYTQ